MIKFINPNTFTTIMKIDELEREYVELIDLICKKELNIDIPNSSLVHARYVIKKFLDNTKTKIDIFTHDLDKNIFWGDDVINSVKNNKNIKIRFLLNEINKSDINDFVKKTNHSNIEFKRIENESDISYFIISDDKRIRLESKSDKNKAKVNFNNPKLSGALNGTFMGMWEKAKGV